MRSIQNMARKGILPKQISNCTPPMCDYFQYYKVHRKSSKKDNPIFKEDITKPVYLIHMYQAVSSLLGICLTAYENTCKKKCTTISIFVASVSKKIFA